MKIQKVDGTLVGRIEDNDLVHGLDVVNNRPELYVKDGGKIYRARMLKRVGRMEPYFVLRNYYPRIDPDLTKEKWVTFSEVRGGIEKWEGEVTQREKKSDDQYG